MKDERKSRRRMAGTVAAVLALGAGAAVVLPSGASGDDDNGRFTLYQHDTDQARLDLGAPGPGVGDQYIFGGDLFDRQGGTKVGRSAGHCAASSPTELLCAASLSITAGQITIEGLVDVVDLGSSRPVTFAVTGGTDRYRKTRGTVTITIVPGVPTDANVEVDLR